MRSSLWMVPILAFLLAAGSFITGCQKTILVPSLPALPTPTPIPQCVSFTHITIPNYLNSNGVTFQSGANPFFVFRNQGDWDNYCVAYYPEPAVPVTFGQSMILAFSQSYGDLCGEYVKITSVCYFFDHIEVSYDYRSQYKDSSCQLIACSQVLGSYSQEVVQVPQSSLPVIWIKNDLCP